MPSEEEAVRYASECWEKGYNCTESVLRGVCHGLEMELPEVALKMATPFGGGVGRSEDLCGALSGGVLAIGSVLGRTKNEEDRFVSYNAARDLHDRFQNKFGSSLCCELNFSDFTTPEHRERCGSFILETVRTTFRIIRRA
jgi:C_GCAxxG_C_C family probable redox protein